MTPYNHFNKDRDSIILSRRIITTPTSFILLSNDSYGRAEPPPQFRTVAPTRLVRNHESNHLWYFYC